jgi:hypothetical protein
MNQPKVSIGLPVYNGDDYLSEALDSEGLCKMSSVAGGVSLL